MADPRRANVFSIPANRSFADALVANILKKTVQASPTALARTTIILPNSRAIRAVSEAFVRASNGALLMPRLVPIGGDDLHEDLGGGFDVLDRDTDISPAIDAQARRAILTRLIMETRTAHGQPLLLSDAVRLATALARTLDELLYEDVAPSRLTDVAVDDLSRHWDLSLNLLRLLLDQWPNELARLGRIDAADRRNRLLAGLAARWATTPPADPVYAAGINVTSPAVAALLRRIAFMPRGTVVLADLDLDLTDAQWDAIALARVHDRDDATHRRADETHPQYALKLLLHRMGIARAEVIAWPGGMAAKGSGDARRRLISTAMLPAPLTSGWSALRVDPRSLAGLQMIEAAHPDEEAHVIAIALREAVETPGRRAALVTADRLLATRVAAILRRWDIVADDSAGQPITATPPGSFIMALADALAQGCAPVALMSLLQHPLSVGSIDRIAWLDQVRKLDLLLRGPRPPGGLAAIDALVAGAADPPLAEWWADVSAILADLVVLGDSEQPVDRLLVALAHGASALTAQQIWAGSNGRLLSQAISDLAAALGREGLCAAIVEVPALLSHMLADIAVRLPQGGHPRIAILGLLEARLQQHDLMILGGLNEGTWPALPQPDPWLAPRIRRELGLPGLERRIGLSAHDLTNALGSQEVLLTRARRDEARPTIPSRFWMRLRALIGKDWPRNDRLLTLARQLDAAEGPHPIARPAPRPPRDARPRRVSVTQVDRLSVDPFAFYAEHILRCRSLRALDADADAAWRGTQVHAIFERWLKDTGGDPVKLVALGDAMLGSPDNHVTARIFWRPRILAALDSFAARIAEDCAQGREPVLAEATGSIIVDGVTLTGKADRIDLCDDGTIAIVDYKSGKPPTMPQIANGYALQLGLLGLIAQDGGFDDRLPQALVSRLEYWSLAKSKDDRFGMIKSIAEPVAGRHSFATADMIGMARRHFAAAAAAWLTGDAAFVARPHPDAPVYSEYDHLMRLQEWDGTPIIASTGAVS